MTTTRVCYTVHIMDPLYVAISLFRRRKFAECAQTCTDILDKDPSNQAAWCLKMQALTKEVYVDDLDVDEEGLAESLLDDQAVARVARPGTSLRTPAQNISHALRPVTRSGRPVTGVVRPDTQGGGGPGLERAIRTARSAATARPATSASARKTRLSTAVALGQPGGQFINLARLNVSKYAGRPAIAKPLFQYLYYHENDTRLALDLAAQATQACDYKDWWWKLQLGKCYFRLGMLRDAERQFRSAQTQQAMMDTFLWLGKVYIRLDQPLAALEAYRQGLDLFPGDATLLTCIGRIYEGLHDINLSVKCYKDVLTRDAINVEAIACIATNHFYSDQPEVALRYYRRLLQMGVYTAELYNNLALCCFYAQQFDVALTCFERALAIANDDTLPHVWYNLGHIGLGAGDRRLATQCFRLALVYDNNHAESYNNLGVIELSRRNHDQGKAYFKAAAELASHLYEPAYNYAMLMEEEGNYEECFRYVQKSIQAFPQHADSKTLLSRMKKLFSAP
ncbi:tetratricopeptide repeat protein 8-like isoform X1 [Ornithodoros turicata]|uniref:tetratricopeptide repeat protein 8-like isoform X1 n=1 Tax=Ornithodoros turicata TaxID=34597 RepID=UPI003139EB4F